MTNRALGTRLLLSMGIMSLLIIVIAMSGRLAVRHVLDTTQDVLVRDGEAIGSASDDRMRARMALLQAEGAATTNEMTWMAVLAIVVAGVVAYRVRAALIAA